MNTEHSTNNTARERGTRRPAYTARPDGTGDASQRTQAPRNTRGNGRGTGHRNAPNKTRGNTGEKTRGAMRSRGNGRGGRNGHHRRIEPALPKREAAIIPPLPKDAVRIVPLGGVEEVGKNMILVETQTDIVVMDVGFQFSESNTPGIDYILPNTKYLEERKDKVRGVVITHGHLDHIGGIPYLMERIGNPPIYTRHFTGLMIKKRQEEFPSVPELDIREVEPGQRVKMGETDVEFFGVTHSIPDSMGVMIRTEHGNILVSGDLRLDHKDGKPTDLEEERWTKLGKENNLLFIGDSTNAENPGFSIPESRIYETIEEIIRTTPGRLIIGTFASQVERMIRIIQACEKLGKKIVTDGRSIRTNIEIAQMAGLLEPKEGTIIPIQEIDNYPPDRVVVLATGGQGEEFATLSRIGRKEHKFITLTERDTVVLSSSVIPGNEISVQKLKDNLYRHGIRVIHYRVSDVHASGHGNQEELVWINKKVNAKFFMPGYGFHSMLRVHAQVITDRGFPKENVIMPDNGSVIDIVRGETVLKHKEKAPAWPVYVDGFSVGDTQQVVIRDRQALAQEGMFVIVATIDTSTGRTRKSPDIISRGFVYLKEEQELLRQTRLIIKKTIEDGARGMHPINFDDLKRDITDNVSRYLFQKTNKRPVVIPVLLGV